MKLLDIAEQARKEHDELYKELQEAPIDLDGIFSLMVNTLHDSYVGYEAKRLYFTANEYRTYVLSHHRYNSLTLQMLVRSLHQFCGDMHDRRLRFSCSDWVDYKNLRAGYRVRAYEDCLYVTSAEPETGLVPGDRLMKLQRMTPEQVRRYTRHNCFYSREKERELWGGYLCMVRSAEVMHADGSTEVLQLPELPARDEEYELSFRMMGSTAYLKLEKLDYDELDALLTEHESELAAADKLILDLRRCIGGDEDCAALLLPYMLDEERSYASLEADEGHYTLFSKQNCDLRYKLLSDLLETAEDYETIAILTEEREAYVKNYGKGLVFVPPCEEDDFILEPAAKAPGKTVILCDTFCENEGESLIAMAKRAGDRVSVIGRPSMGTLDYFDTIKVSLNDHMSLTYPISETKAAHDGRGIAEKGLPVDEYIPWTPEEISRDVILERALNI